MSKGEIMDSCEIKDCEHGKQYRLGNVWMCYRHFWMFVKSIKSYEKAQEVSLYV